MKLKAQNTIEIISMIVVVLVVVISAFVFMQGNSVNLANLSRINITGTANTDAGVNAESKNEHTFVGSNSANIETAGSLSGIIANMSDNELGKAVKSKPLSAYTNVKSSDQKDIFDLANELIDELSLPVSPFDKTDLSENSKNALVQVAIKAKNKLNGRESSTYTEYSALLAQIIK